MSGVSDAAGCVETDVDPLVAVYRHDVHKARWRSHEEAAGEWGGVRVNEPVPCGADGDAALLSRAGGEPVKTVDNHDSPFRVSLLTGNVASAPGEVGGIRGDFEELVRHEEGVAMHRAWVESSVAAMFSESPYFPYTSLKYHTLLTGALLSNYRSGFEFDELCLVVDSGGEVTPHRTVLSVPGFGLRVTGEPGGDVGARLGDVPGRSFADTWSRLPEHPVDVTGDRVWRVLDAELRRIRSWSTALQFIEDFVAWRKSVEGGGVDG